MPSWLEHHMWGNAYAADRNSLAIELKLHTLHAISFKKNFIILDSLWCGQPNWTYSRWLISMDLEKYILDPYVFSLVEIKKIVD